MFKIYEQDQSSQSQRPDKNQGELKVSKQEIAKGAETLGDLLGKNYSDFIKKLTGQDTPADKGKLVSIDPKVVAVLNMGKKDLDLTDEVVNYVEKDIPVTDLKPTQSQIGLYDSIGYVAFVKPGAAAASLNGAANFGGERILTANGKYILDGHHRWSGVYILNPNATIPCLDIQLKTEDPGNLLKVIQLAIAASYGKIYMKAANAKSDIFSEEVIKNNDGLKGLLKNIFSGKFGVVEDKGGKIENIPEFIKTVYEKIKSKLGAQDIDPKEVVINYLAENSKLLRENNSPEGTTPARFYMPQPGDTREESGLSGKNIDGIPAEVINKLTSGELNFKKALTPEQAEKTTESKKSERKYLKTFEQFTRYRNQ